MPLKIAMIGAGSIGFTRKLMHDILAVPELNDTHFAFMADLRAGDILTLQRLDGGTARYAVRQFQTVRWDRFAISRNLPGEWLVLATCYPFDGATRGPLRQVAWAERVE